MITVAWFSFIPTFVLADMPVITGIDDITAEATSSSGAFVTFSITATDTATSIPVLCSPQQNSLFALGTTTVNCEAGNGIATSTATFNVIVVDTTPPIIIPPNDQTFSASTFPTSPAITLATATDIVDSNPVITFSPLSFPIGTTTITWTATDFSGNTNATTSQIFIADDSPLLRESATIVIRDKGKSIGPFAVDLPGIDELISISPTGTTTAYEIPARSVLALLVSIDESTSLFDITDLQYFSSFNSFLVNCIFVPEASETSDCFSWTYAVNNNFPYSSVDKFILQNGDNVYIIFGNEWQISTNKSVLSTNESFIASVKRYDPLTGSYVPANGEIVGVVQFDENFIATEFATSTANENGEATFSVSEIGDYKVGLTSTGYFPNATITVSEPTTTQINGENPPANGGGGGGGGSIVSNNNIDVGKALQFLADNQNDDGSFESPLYTDWVAIALAAGPESSSKEKIKSFLKTSNDNLRSATDYERRAMAVMSLGINPYSGTKTNLIQKILEKFDGNQIGDPSLVNDDIFAIFPLVKAGYSTGESIIEKIVVFIISNQKSDGSWDESADLTASAIQVLSLVSSLPNVEESLHKAEIFLKTAQRSDAGFGNSFSTSWAIQAIVAVGDSPLNWITGNATPNNSLFLNQQTDGGLEPRLSEKNYRIWATAYAIPAALGKTWNSIMANFSKPESFDGGQTINMTGGMGNSEILSDSLLTISTTTSTTTISLEVATSTAATSSSTPKLTNVVSSVALKKPTIIKSTRVNTEQNALLSQTKEIVASSSKKTNDSYSATQLAAIGENKISDSIKVVASIIFGIILAVIIF